MIRIFAALTVMSFLPACVSPVGPADQMRKNVTLQPDNLGLRVDPLGKRIDFGRSPKGVIPVLDRELGRHSKMSLENCPVRVVQQMKWGDLTLTFSRERFVGWRNLNGQQGVTCT